MRNIAICLLVWACSSCNNSPGGSDNMSDSSVNNGETISEIRTVINTSPIASYHEKVKDALNDWGFDVKVYETGHTFNYLMKIKYEEIEASDTLKIPNAGIKPEVELHKGNDKYSCIVGFLNKEHKFLAYKQVSIQDNQLKIKVLNHYGVYSVIK